MGERGPVPKRVSERLGHLTKAQKAEAEQVRVPSATKDDDGTVRPPRPNSKWHPIARAWYGSLANSGQSRFYEPSDWQVAYVWAELLSRELRNPHKVSAMMMASWNSVQADLLTTEGSRRRVRLEFMRAQTEAAAAGGTVTIMDQYRDALS
jgi:hypothetical protein